jgi:hypothetical protein
MEKRQMKELVILSGVLPVGGTKSKDLTGEYSPIFAQVIPLWVEGANQGEFFLSGPAFELLFAGNGSIYVVGLFEVDEAVEVITSGEAFDQFLFVLRDTASEIAGYADVEHTGRV